MKTTLKNKKETGKNIVSMVDHFPNHRRINYTTRDVGTVV